MTTQKATKNHVHDSRLEAELSLCMQERGFTQSAVARGLGISDSALSQWRAGRYKGDVKSLEQAIKSFLQLDSERIKNRKITLPFTMTSVADKVFEAARMCHLDGDIGVVVGTAGVGKTTAVKEYARRNSDVILIEADLGYTAKEVFREIHRKLGFDGGGSINQMKDDVINKLKDAGRLIIVDEAEHLPVRALDLLRRINDKAGTGILFCGLRRFMENLRLKRADFAYLYTRVGFKVIIDTLQGRDIERIIKGVIPSSNGLWKTYHEESQGNCRVLSKLVVRSMRISEVNNIDISAEMVRKAAKMLAV